MDRLRESMRRLNPGLVKKKQPSAYMTRLMYRSYLPVLSHWHFYFGEVLIQGITELEISQTTFTSADTVDCFGYFVFVNSKH